MDGETAAYVQRHVPGPVTVRRVEGAGHNVPLDGPDESAWVIADLAGEMMGVPAG